MPHVPADSHLATCEQILDYTFTDKLLGLEALNTAGRGNALLFGGGLYTEIPRNKIMAEFGDKIADFVVMGEWMKCCSSRRARFLNVGVSWDLTKKGLLSNTALCARGKAFGLQNCILVNPGSERISVEMVARTMEALVGAVFQDGGVEAATRVLRRLGILGRDRGVGMRMEGEEGWGL